MIRSNTLSTLTQVFADIQIMSSCGIHNKFSISAHTLCGSAAGRSILFSTGIISKFKSIAMYNVESVCACIPCEASINKITHSTAASERETSY